MKKKKIVVAVLAAAALSAGAFGLSACNVQGQSGETDDKIATVYELYVANAELNSQKPLSYDEWLKTVKGEKGEKGEKGDQGIQGEKGDTGAQGAKGDKGDKGDQGDQGAKGEKGDKGDQGIQGEKGDKGDTGAQGAKGDKGDKGDQGIQGEKGDKGDQGIQGEKGDKGDQGIQGEKGDKGDQGIQGEKGDKGDPGKDAATITGVTIVPQDKWDISQKVTITFDDSTTAEITYNKVVPEKAYRADSVDEIATLQGYGVNRFEVYDAITATNAVKIEGATVVFGRDISFIGNNGLDIKKSVTVDLNHHALIGKLNYALRAQHTGSDVKNVVIKNGEILCNKPVGAKTTYAGVYVNNLMNVTLDGVDIKASGEKDSTGGVYGLMIGNTSNKKKSATVTLDGCEIYGATAGVTVWGTPEDATGKQTLVTKSSKISGAYYGIAGNGNSHNTKIEITGGSVKGLDGQLTATSWTANSGVHSTGIYHPQDGELIINSGAIGGVTGIEMRAGTLTVNAGNIYGATDGYSEKANGNGTTICGAAIALSQHTTAEQLTLNYNGGILTGKYALYETDLCTYAEGAATAPVPVINWKEGTKAKIYGMVYSKRVTGFIKGGWFVHTGNNLVKEEIKTSLDTYLNGEYAYTEDTTMYKVAKK